MSATLVGKSLSYSKENLQSINFTNFRFNSNQYNQYVQTQMLKKQENSLTNQQKDEIQRHIYPTFSNYPGQERSKKSVKFQKLLRMPIPMFEIDKMKESDQDEEKRLKISLGVQKQNSFYINSQKSQKQTQVKNIESVSTQTDDFTYVSSLFQQAKVYQIPVQMQLLQLINKQTKEVQTVQNINKKDKQEIQDFVPAVRRQNYFQMQSGTVSINIVNFSFQRENYSYAEKEDLLLDGREGSGNEGGNESEESENNQCDQSQEDEGYDEELLLSGQNEVNKQNLFQTARFEPHFDNYATLTPPKSRLSGSQNSPETNQMRMSEREINMMQMISCPQSKIDEQQYEHLQNRFHALEQQNMEKNEQIQTFNERIRELENELKGLNDLVKEKHVYEKQYKKLQKQFQLKEKQYQRIIDKLQQVQTSLNETKQQQKINQQQYESLLFTKQQQIQSLLKQIEIYKQQLSKEQQKCNKQTEHLQSIIHQKDNEIHQLKHEHDKKYQIYIISIKQMKEKIVNYQICIEKLQMENVKKDQKIIQIKEISHKLREENSILRQQLQHLKDWINRSSFSSSFHKKQSKLEEYNVKKGQKFENVKNYQERNYTTKEGLSTVNHNKVFKSQNAISEQTQKTKSQEFQETNRKILSSSETQNMTPQQATIFIEESNHKSKFDTYSFRKPFSKLSFNHQTQYVQQLEKFIIIYENIIESKIETIEELQDKVVQFLKDALVKQNEAELLYNQLCQYENSMNSLLVQKLDVQLENQRLKKMITESENKLSILGNRLIKLAKSNSTISFMERSPHSNSFLEQRSK